MRQGRFVEAERLFAEGVALAPDFREARGRYALLLLDRLDKPGPALEQIEILIKQDPAHPGYRAVRAAILGLIGDYDGAIAQYEDVLARQPRDHRSWLRYGHMLKTVDRVADAVAAYRQAIVLQPGNGEAYWSIADLKTVRLTVADRDAIRVALNWRDLPGENRTLLHFALGKALEDDGAYGDAFAQYERANALRRASLRYDPGEMTACVRAAKEVFTPAFFAERERHGAEDPAPIFVVGLPRSGSTLVEQILASHPDIEGTMELPDLVAVSRRVSANAAGLPAGLAALPVEQFGVLGNEYLERTKIFRRLGRRHFIDKMSGNFVLTPLIHLALPQAKIIDVRRHPMACCFSAFKQYFAGGQSYSYGLSDLGQFYAEYVELMAHYDSLLPGRVHRVIYEDLVADPEREIRRLLDHCGVPFDERCLRFHDTARAVRTSSAQQVRRPISADGLEQWRNFEPYLGPLKAALGTALENYRGA